MKSINKTLFWLSIASFFVSSATILFMPLGSFSQESQIVSFILAIIFWLFLITGFVFQYILSKQRKKDKNPGGKSENISDKPRRFFRNKPASVFDTLLIIGVITFMLAFIIRSFPEWVMWAAIFISVFSLEMHVVFNGKNYEYISHGKSTYFFDNKEKP